MAWMGTGGNNIPMKLEQSNQKVMMFNPAQPNNDAIETDKSVSLIARMGTGGNQVPLIVEDTKEITMLQSNQQNARIYEDASVSFTLTAAMGEGGGHVPMIVQPSYYEHHPQDSRVKGPKDIGNSVTKKYGTGGGNVPLVVEKVQPEHVYWLKTLRTGGDCEKSVCPALTAQTGDTLPTVIDHSESTLTQDIYRKSKNAQSVDDFETWVKDEKTNTLASFYSQPNIAIVEHHAYNITFNDANGTRKDRPNGGCYINDTDVSNAITTGGVHDTKVVEHEMEHELCSTLCARDYKGPSNDDFTASSQKLVLEHQHEQQKVQSKVRKLTPIECERLQGFPDDYTQIPYNKKSAENCPDSPRYKALGNSMAVPVMRWLACRIALVDGLLVPSFRPTPTKVDK
jgi:hypothetical protein